jgi:hypothetical protein
MPLKKFTRMKSSKFIDFQTSEEANDGSIIENFDDEDDFDDEENEEDRAFINDNPESDEHISECSSVHESEKECCDDDLLLIEDNQRENRKSRIRRVIDESSEDSDDSFIDDSDVTPAPKILSKTNSLPQLVKNPTTVPNVCKPRPSNFKVPASSLFTIKEWVSPETKIYKPKSSADWNFLKKPSQTKLSKIQTTETTSGVIKTSDGDYLVKNGKRHKLMEGNVCWSNKS